MIDDRYDTYASCLGGVTLLRAAAKNHSRVTVICDPADYARYFFIENPFLITVVRKLFCI